MDVHLRILGPQHKALKHFLFNHPETFKMVDLSKSYQVSEWMRCNIPHLIRIEIDMGLGVRVMGSNGKG